MSGSVFDAAIQMLSDIRFFNRPPFQENCFASPRCRSRCDAAALIAVPMETWPKHAPGNNTRFPVDAHLHANYDNATRDIVMLVACSGS